MTHEPGTSDDDTDEIGRHRVFLTPERPSSDRLPLSQILRGEARPPRTRLRRGSGLVGASLVGAAVVLSGAWAVQNVVVPESTEDPQGRGLWAPSPRVPPATRSAAAKSTTRAAPVSAPESIGAPIGVASGSGSGSGSSVSGAGSPASRARGGSDPSGPSRAETPARRAPTRTGAGSGPSAPSRSRDPGSAPAAPPAVAPTTTTTTTITTPPPDVTVGTRTDAPDDSDGRIDDDPPDVRTDNSGPGSANSGRGGDSDDD